MTNVLGAKKSLKHICALNQDTMAYANKIIRNKVTGQKIKFLKTARDTSGLLLEMETTYHGFTKEPHTHFHPQQQEYFTVQEGKISVRINGLLRILKKGDQIHIPKNIAHSMWNHTNTKAVVNWKVQPAMDTEYLLETAFGLASEGKLNEKGMPRLLQVSLMVPKYKNVFRLARPLFPFQQVAFALLRPFAKLAGLQPDYKKYFD